jgi:hypothetical protein
MIGGRTTKMKKAPLYFATCTEAWRSAASAAAVLSVIQSIRFAREMTLLWRRRRIRGDGVGGANCVFPYQCLKS